MPSTNEGETKLQGDVLQLAQTAHTIECNNGDTSVSLGDPLDELENPTKGADNTVDGNHLVAKNLKIIAGHLLVLANRIVETDEYSDTPAIVGFYYMLPYYDKVLPKLLSDQLRAATYFLPSGLPDTNMFHHVFPSYKSEQEQEKKANQQI